MGERLTAATLFSGIGAPEVAMPHWRWPWHAEIEKFPSAVMTTRHPHSLNLGDVSAEDFTQRALAAGRPDVLVFGSPCQSYSVAGKRLGLDDPRGNLALVALGIVGRLKPRWFVFENVPGLLSSSEGRDFGIFLRTVDELRYSGCWAVLDAQFAGVAQRRRRVFFVGHIGDWRGPAAVLLEPESLRGNSPPLRQAGQITAPTIASRPTGGGGLGTDFDLDGGLIAFGGNRTSGSVDIATTLQAHAGPAGRLDFASETFVTVAPTLDANYGRLQGHDNQHIDSGAGLFVAGPIAFDCKASGRSGFGVGEIAPTLWSMNNDKSHPNAGGQIAAQTRFGVRRLTPRECERLQGFPDDYTLIPYRGKPAADGPRYKALGNSMAVPVMRHILSRIEFVDALACAKEAA